MLQIQSQRINGFAVMTFDELSLYMKPNSIVTLSLALASTLRLRINSIAGIFPTKLAL